MFLRNLYAALSRNLLPCHVLSRKPLILAAYDSDFLNRIGDFAAALRNVDRAWLFMQLGWQRETERTAAPLISQIREAGLKIPQLEIIVLANSPKEAGLLSSGGIQAAYCHQNAFLDASRYRILKRRKYYDAIYIARITPFKRHFLAAEIPSLRLIGHWSAQEADFAADTLRQLPQAAHSKKIISSRIPEKIAEAACGLCLSAEEGAMFVSAEYLLCGQPVVNTANIGGRDLLMPEFAVKPAADTPEAVAEAVEEWRRNPPAPEKIRNATIELMQPHRRNLLELINRIYREERRRDPSSPAFFSGGLPHKLGLRCHRSLWTECRHGLAASTK